MRATSPWIPCGLALTVLTVLTGILTTVNIDESGRQMIFGATLLVLMLFYGRGRAMRA